MVTYSKSKTEKTQRKRVVEKTFPSLWAKVMRLPIICPGRLQCSHLTFAKIPKSENSFGLQPHDVNFLKRAQSLSSQTKSKKPKRKTKSEFLVPIESGD